MSLFNPGSEAVIKDAPCLGAIGKPYIGEEVTIHFRLSEAQIPPQFRVHPSGDAVPFYAVSLRDGVRSVLCGHCLAHRPDDAHTWSGIQALTGWHPPVLASAERREGGAA